MGEGLAHSARSEGSAVAIGEEWSLIGLGGTGCFLLCGVSLHGLRKLRPKGNDAGFAEFRLTYSEQRGLQIDITQREPERLSASQAGTVKQQQEGAECVWLQLIDPFAIRFGGIQQTTQLVT